MNASGLYERGDLDAAIDALGEELRDNPGDVRRRTFLFELLCFAGKYDRAERQLDILEGGGRDAEMGIMTYRTILFAERTRQEKFEKGDLPSHEEGPPPVRGTLNGKPFEELTDADPRVGARLEIHAGGQYTWIPFQHLASVRMEPPKRLRDLVWAPANVSTGVDIRDVDLGEVILPALAPLTWKHPDGEVRLGRRTEWADLDDELAAPIGQKLLVVDGELFPVLELRSLEISGPSESAS